MKRSTLFLHVPTPDRGLTVEGHPLPNLPASARAVLSDPRRTTPSAIKAEIIVQADTPWVVDGNQSIKFRVVKDTELSLHD